jgi:hypothetical protein
MHRLLSVAAILAALLACGDATTEPTPPAAPEAPAKPPLPEGLTAFAPADAPLRTAYPTEGAAQATTCDDAGCSYVFGLPGEDGAPRQDASVTFFFPKGSPTVDALRQSHVDGADGLFARHPEWTRNATSGGNAVQPWLTEAISFESDAEIGRVMIGNGASGAFLITERIGRGDADKARPILVAVYTHLELVGPR